MQKSIFEQCGGTYTQVGDYFFPDLMLEETDHAHIRKYGRMRKQYLKEHRPILFSSFLLSGKLDQHLAETDRACEERMDFIMCQMAKHEGLTEALKAADQMEWVRRMNSIRSRAEEIVMRELIYTEETRDANT